MDGFIHKVVVFAFFVASGNALKSQNYIDFSHRSRLPRFFHFEAKHVFHESAHPRGRGRVTMLIKVTSQMVVRIQAEAPVKS